MFGVQGVEIELFVSELGLGRLRLQDVGVLCQEYLGMMRGLGLGADCASLCLGVWISL